MMKNLLRVALYIRVSHEEQVISGLSLEAQEETLRKFAMDNNMHIVDLYADKGISARKKLQNRHEFQRLIQDIKDEKIDLVLVTKLDRWFRNIKDYHNTQEILESHNCNWKAILEEYDTSTASGRLHINIMLSVNQDEADRTSERIKQVFKHKLEQGEVISGSAPIGFKIVNKRLVHNNEAEMIKDIYNHYEMNNSIKKTAVYVGERYRKIFHETIRRILTDPIYTGTHKSGVENYCEPIVSKEQFCKVQEIIKMNKKSYTQTGNKTEYIFSGMVKCKCCDHSMWGHRVGRVDHKLNAYGCPQYTKAKMCENQYKVTEGMIERKLLENIKPELEKYKMTLEAVEPLEQKKDTVAHRAKIRKRLKKLKDLYLDDLIDKDEYKNDYEQLQTQLTDLEKEPEKKQVDIEAINKFLSQDFQEIYKELNPNEKRYLWQSILDHVEVGRSRNEITPVFK